MVREMRLTSANGYDDDDDDDDDDDGDDDGIDPTAIPSSTSV